MRKKQFGSYALIFCCRYSSDVVVGALGRVILEPGWLVYVGSAFGPGGIESRISHHKRPSDNPHWHIDYIKPYVDLVKIFTTTKRIEHKLAQILINSPKAKLLKRGFGSSDCNCNTHLIHFESFSSIEGIIKLLHSSSLSRQTYTAI
ncbi:MAG: GIY-YIG nuclease family protein [SAR202 cluster bacterium]|jgi:Uri superfamily endonuclease|nr:GIY-YIG nuclease family protein [SAR202 cluster bacterium]MQG46545.1 GIY-YIG nuclease family protein [SAR202 cluster bacterium]